MTSVSSISPEKKKQIAAKVSSVGIVGNILLSVFKLIAGIIGHSGAMISDSIHSMSDVFATAIAGYIKSPEDVLQLTLLHTRLFGSKIYVDAEVSMDGSKTLDGAHAVAERIHDGVEEQFPNIKHIMIHVNPAQ